MISPELRQAISRDLDRWEGFYAWMYLDSVGLVTVGFGTMLPNADAAASIPFTHLKGLGATLAEVRAAYETVHKGSQAQKSAAAKEKYGARHYEKITDLRISRQTGARLRDSHVDADYASLKNIYANFDDFPDPAKIALFDMIYNLGPGAGRSRKHRATGLRAYVTMNDAIASGDFATAAQHCRRRGIPADRNAMTVALFNSCAAAKQ